MHERQRNIIFRTIKPQDLAGGNVSANEAESEAPPPKITMRLRDISGEVLPVSDDPSGVVKVESDKGVKATMRLSEVKLPLPSNVESNDSGIAEVLPHPKINEKWRLFPIEPVMQEPQQSPKLTSTLPNTNPFAGVVYPELKGEKFNLLPTSAYTSRKLDESTRKALEAVDAFLVDNHLAASGDVDIFGNGTALIEVPMLLASSEDLTADLFQERFNELISDWIIRGAPDGGVRTVLGMEFGILEGLHLEKANRINSDKLSVLIRFKQEARADRTKNWQDLYVLQAPDGAPAVNFLQQNFPASKGLTAKNGETICFPEYRGTSIGGSMSRAEQNLDYIKYLTLVSEMQNGRTLLNGPARMMQGYFFGKVNSQSYFALHRYEAGNFKPSDEAELRPLVKGKYGEYSYQAMLRNAPASDGISSRNGRGTAVVEFIAPPPQPGELTDAEANLEAVKAVTRWINKFCSGREEDRRKILSISMERAWGAWMIGPSGQSLNLNSNRYVIVIEYEEGQSEKELCARGMGTYQKENLKLNLPYSDNLERAKLRTNRNKAAEDGFSINGYGESLIEVITPAPSDSDGFYQDQNIRFCLHMADYRDRHPGRKSERIHVGFQGPGDFVDPKPRWLRMFMYQRFSDEGPDVVPPAPPELPQSYWQNESRVRWARSKQARTGCKAETGQRMRITHYVAPPAIAPGEEHPTVNQAHFLYLRSLQARYGGKPDQSGYAQRWRTHFIPKDNKFIGFDFLLFDYADRSPE